MNGKYRFRVGEIPIKPYVVVGAGMYSFKEKFEVTGLPTEDATATKAGGHGGLGASYMVNEKFGIGAEGNYHFVSTEGTSTKYLTGLVTLTYHIPASK